MASKTTSESTKFQKRAFVGYASKGAAGFCIFRDAETKSLSAGMRGKLKVDCWNLMHLAKIFALQITKVLADTDTIFYIS